MRPATGHFRAPGRFPPALRRGIGVGLACLTAWGVIAAADDAVPRLPDPVRTSHTVFAIPFKVAPSQQEDHAPTRVLLQASTDLGATWVAAGEASPTAGSIVYRATADGEYWFRMRAIDAKGRQRGGEGPDMRVVVDAAAPRVAARVWRGGDGEIVCRYAAVDDSLDPAKLVLEYRTKAEPNWKRLASEAVLSREAPAHLIGEEIWWAGEKPEGLAVRLSVADAAGHRTVKQFALEPTDPGVDQGMLAAEIGAPPLPGQGPAPQVAAAPPSPAPTAFPAPTPPEGWPAETDARWEGTASAAEGPSGATSVLARPVGTGPLDRGDAAAPAPAPTATFPAPPPAMPSLEAAAPGPSSPDGTVRVLPTEYRGRPLHIVRSRHFSWEYEMQIDRPDAGAVRVELWSTTDGGFTWQRSAVDDDAASPIEVTLPAAGLYGFRLEIVPDTPGAGGGPRAGEIPDGWIGIDDEPPQVEIVEARRVEAENVVLIRWSARDKLLAPASVRLLHSPNPDGPWATIAEGLDGNGERRWTPDRGVPARVYLRVEATDAAGSVGRATTPEPVTIAVPRAVGKLGGIKPLP